MLPLKHAARLQLIIDGDEAGVLHRALPGAGRGLHRQMPRPLHRCSQGPRRHYPLILSYPHLFPFIAEPARQSPAARVSHFFTPSVTMKVRLKIQKQAHPDLDGPVLVSNHFVSASNAGFRSSSLLRLHMAFHAMNPPLRPASSSAWISAPISSAPYVLYGGRMASYA